MAGYQGYGQTPYGQSYGNDYGAEKKKNQNQEDYGEEYYQDDNNCCKSNSAFARLDNWCIGLTCFGGLLCMVSTFIPMWRVDPEGTSGISEYWKYNGFSQRSYGVYHVKGSWSQSWVTLSQAACDIRNIGHITGLAEALGRSLTQWIGTAECGGSQSCQQGFVSHMHARCLDYQTLMRISMVTMTGSFLAVILIIAGTLTTSMSKRRATGGIAFGLYMFAGILLCIVNTVWAVVTDVKFKDLAKNAWYPYPSLHVGFYLHVAGYSMVLIFNAIFGFIVMPEVWKFDPAQDKLDKKKKKLEKKMAREQKYAQKKEQLQAIMNANAQQPGHFPPPPGYGQAQPQPQAVGYGYGAPQQPQQPAPLGFSGQQQAPQSWGQGGAQPVSNPGDFGLGTPAGSGPPPVAQPGGFGIATPQQVMSDPSSGGYGSYGSGQGQEPAKRPSPAGYNWPAYQGGDQWNAMPGPPPAY
jgi:hypothetical protein